MRSLVLATMAALLRQRGLQNPKRLWPHAVKRAQFCLRTTRELSHGPIPACASARSAGPERPAGKAASFGCVVSRVGVISPSAVWPETLLLRFGYVAVLTGAPIHHVMPLSSRTPALRCP
jgi:hypothetical protein